MNTKVKNFSNVYFATQLQQAGMVDPRIDHYLELSDENSTPVCHYLSHSDKDPYLVLHCNHNTITCNLEQLSFLAENRYVLANGYYPEIPYLVDRLIMNSPVMPFGYEFLVGVCGNESDKEVKDDIEQFHLLRKSITDDYGIDEADGLLVYDCNNVTDGMKSYFLYYTKPATIPYRKWYRC